MKRFVLISCLLVSGLVSLAEDPAPKVEASEPGDAPKIADAQDGITEARLKKVRDLPFSAKEVMELQTTGTLKDATYTLDASVSVSLPRDAKGKQKALAKYTKSGKVPFKIYTHVQVSVPGKKQSLYTKDKANICIIDKDNNIVLKKNEALIKLCRS